MQEHAGDSLSAKLADYSTGPGRVTGVVYIMTMLALRD